MKGYRHIGGGVWTYVGPERFLLQGKYREVFVRKWGKGFRLTSDPKEAGVFEVSGAGSGRSVGQRARVFREKVEARLNVPLEVVWWRNQQK